MIKILYIHSLSSSGASNTVNNLRAQLPEGRVIAPDLPLCPYEALKQLKAICQSESPDVVVGVSMGGMFAQHLHGYKKILINPTFNMSSVLKKSIGVHPFFSPRKDGVMKYEVTEELCNKYGALELVQFRGVTDFDKKHTYGFFAKNKAIINCEEEYRKHYTNVLYYQGAHRLRLSVLKNQIIPLIRKIQEDAEILT